MGYDIGNVIANMIFAWANGDAAGAEEFCNWVENVLVDVVNMTKEKMEKYYEEHVTDTMCKNELYRKYYMATIIEDTSAVTGLELIRRIVGMANVKDITSIEDEQNGHVQRKSVLPQRLTLLKTEVIKSVANASLVL